MIVFYIPTPKVEGILPSDEMFRTEHFAKEALRPTCIFYIRI
jgi:hypothetical protein